MSSPSRPIPERPAWIAPTRAIEAPEVAHAPATYPPVVLASARGMGEELVITDSFITPDQQNGGHWTLLDLEWVAGAGPGLPAAMLVDEETGEVIATFAAPELGGTERSGGFPTGRRYHFRVGAGEGQSWSLLVWG